MSDIAAGLREEVTLRARNRCENCQLSHTAKRITGPRPLAFAQFARENATAFA